MSAIERVRATLLNWLGAPIDAKSAEFWADFHGTSSATGKRVTVDVAMQVSTVWACVRLLSETVSTLPLKVYRRMPGGGREVARDHPLHALLSRSPNAEMTPGRFMLTVVASLVVRGNAYVEKIRVAGRVVALWPLLPHSVEVRRNDAGRLTYTVLDGKGGKRPITADNMMHIRGFGLDGVAGMQPIINGREVIGATLAASEAAGKVFGQNLHASAVISTERKLNEVQREQFQERLGKFFSSGSANKALLMEDGMKYQGITMTPETAQMLQTRAFNVEEICRWFLVPPFMVGHMDKASSWASSVEAQNLHFLTSTLRPILDNIEQEITRCLIPREQWDEVYAEFSVEGLLRADSAGRAAYYNVLLQNGVMNRNEVRELENRGPIEGGDIYTVQTNLTRLARIGEEPAKSDAARAAVAAWLDEVRNAAQHAAAPA